MPRKKGGVKFHGAFASKADAIKKEKQVHGYIKPMTVGGRRRYAVIVRNPGRKHPAPDHWWEPRPLIRARTARERTAARLYIREFHPKAKYI